MPSGFPELCQNKAAGTVHALLAALIKTDVDFAIPAHRLNKSPEFHPVVHIVLNCEM